MHQDSFVQIENVAQAEGAGAAIASLIATLRDRKEHHKLFDALMLKAKHEHGLPLTRPTSFEDVPADKRAAIEQHYVDAARHVGGLLLDDGDIAAAWLYFRTIREPGPVASAINDWQPKDETDERSETMIRIALHEGVNPVKGIELMLHAHGTCSTITALDQHLVQMSPEMRQQCARVMVRELHQDLCRTVKLDIERRKGTAPQDDSLTSLLAGRDWLFEDGNYHIDFSHLNSVVRFAESLGPGDPELKRAMELANYGAHLGETLQYAGQPPFEEFYPAHLNYFRVLADEDRDQAIDYFRKHVEDYEDPREKQLAALVLVDLLSRVERLDDAVDAASKYLSEDGEEYADAFAQLCERAGRMDALVKVSRDKGDLVGYTAALLRQAAVGDSK